MPVVTDQNVFLANVFDAKSPENLIPLPLYANDHDHAIETIQSQFPGLNIASLTSMREIRQTLLILDEFARGASPVIIAGDFEPSPDSLI